MAVTEITKILFRRGSETDRRQLQQYGGLAQGEPGFTSAEGHSGTLGSMGLPDRFDDQSAFLDINDVVAYGVGGGGDFFVGGTGGSDIYIGGSSAEKHWQRRFVSLSGTGCNTINGQVGDPGYVDGSLQIGAPTTLTPQNAHGDQWDVVLYGSQSTDPAIGFGDYGAYKVHWNALGGVLNVNTTCAVGLPVGTNAQRPGEAGRPDVVAGHIRYNNEQTSFEGYDGNNWGSLGGAEDVLGQTYVTVRQGMPAWSNGGVDEKGETGTIKFVIGTPAGQTGPGGTPPPQATLAGWFDNTLNFHVMQDIIAFDSSDERQKDNVLLIDSPIKKLGQLKGVEFDWNKDGPMWIGDDRHDVGVLAQDVEKIIPSAVTTRADGFKAVDYKRIIPLLIESVKELTARVEELESQNK